MLNDNNMWICPENTELTYICTQLLLKCLCVYVGVVCLRSPPHPLHMNRAEPCAVDSCLLWTVQRQKALNPVTSLFHVFIWYHSSSPYCRSIQLCSLGLQLATTLHSSPRVPHLVPLNEMEEGKKSFWKDSVQLSLTFVWHQNVRSFKTCFHSWGLITFAKNPPQLFRVFKRTPLKSWVTAGIFTVFPGHLACEFKQDWIETSW